MKAFLKLLRILFFFVVYFCIALLIVAFGLQDWSVGGQMLFAFGVPGVLVWWQEKKRSRKGLVQKDSQRHKEGPQSGSDRAAARHSSPENSTNETFRREEPTWQPTAKISRSPKTGWIPSGETASVAGRNIGGMVYVGTPPLLNTYGYRDKCRAYIDPFLSVARSGTDKAGDGMPYWPGYSDISPQCRATYLDWLASGRSDASYTPGYMFLYFYGLERRFFVDQSNEDAKDIVQEVRRLQSLYPDNHSVRRYLGEFLDIAMLAEPDLDAIEPIFERQGWELPFSLKYAIGARIDKGENLTGC